MTSTDWDRRFLSFVSGEINTWSKDPSTKVSAAVFRGKYPVVSSYNGLPPNVEDTEERLNIRELKYMFMQHAEANAISACAKMGIATEGCTMAITHFPCASCAGLIIGAGIRKIVVAEPSPSFMERWGENTKVSSSMFKEAGVEVVVLPPQTSTINL